MRSLPTHTVDRSAGYADRDLVMLGTPAGARRGVLTSHSRWALTVGLVGSLGLTAFYLGTVTLVESWTHALALFQEDAPLVIPIILGFGVQVGLFTYLRRTLNATSGTRAAGAVTGTAGGTSALTMVACCAHHVTDVLPLLGLSGAAILLVQYKTPLMIAGLSSNVAGIGVLLSRLRRAKKRAALKGDHQ